MSCQVRCRQAFACGTVADRYSRPQLSAWHPPTDMTCCEAVSTSFGTTMKLAAELPSSHVRGDSARRSASRARRGVCAMMPAHLVCRRIICSTFLLSATRAVAWKGLDNVNVTHERERQQTRLGVRYLRELARVKTMKKGSALPKDWQQDGFAFMDRRAADFEALRVNKVPSEYEVPRVHCLDLTVGDFREQYGDRGEAVVIDGIPQVQKWKAVSWTASSLAKEFPELRVKVGVTEDDSEDIQMKMEDFDRYVRTQEDDSPLYVFDDIVYDDPLGSEVMSGYQVPQYFPEDLFTTMDQDRERPAYRWLLVGPKRSGSGAHVDPVGTSAWNTLLHGRKLWFLAPPETAHLFDVANSEKDGEACYWFTTVFPPLRERFKSKRHYLLVQHPGETIFVPAGWLHAVLNLDDTVAVTQNFVASRDFEMAWLETKERLPDFAWRWLQKLATVRSDLVMKVLQNVDLSHELPGYDNDAEAEVERAFARSRDL